MWVKVIIVLAFIGIVASLASGLFYLVNDKGESRRTLRALTWRVGISVGLFAFLMILVGLGVIKPHGVYPGQPGPNPVQQQGVPNS
ncbi:MAG: twin transmembrane helix small protein [Gammaproteobacteria bacterium]|nr:twin transmembrane helix small protein [Gammaproteobacteria bacterium]